MVSWADKLSEERYEKDNDTIGKSPSVGDIFIDGDSGER
jgi:hypothetical protein